MIRADLLPLFRHPCPPWIEFNPLLDRVLAGELGFAFGRQHVHQPIAEAGMLDDLATIEGVALAAVHLGLQLVDDDLVKRAHHRQHDLRLLVAAVEAIAGTDEPHLRRLDQFAEPQRLESITVHPTEVVDDEPGDASIRPPFHQHLGHDVAAAARERATHSVVGADVVPRDEDAVAAGPLQHVEQLLIERPGIRPFVAEPDVAEADVGPDRQEARRVEDVEQLGAEPTFEVVGHRLHHGVRNRRHRGRAGQFRPKLGLGLEIGAGEPQQAGPCGQAKVIAAEPAAAVSISIRIVRGTKGTIAGVAGVVAETEHVKNLGGEGNASGSEQSGAGQSPRRSY